MNSLADAATQVSAAAAVAAAAAADATAASASASASVSAMSPSATSPQQQASSSFSVSQTHIHADSFYPSRQSVAPSSPSSNPSPSADMSKSASDTPVRRALLDTEKPEKRGSNLACLKCRAIKVKCSRANVEDDRCKRCNRLDLVCEFKEHHRGRRPKKRPRSEADSAGADEEDQLEEDEADATSYSIKTGTSPVRVKLNYLPRTSPPPTPPMSHPPSYRKTEAGRYELSEHPPKLPSPKGSVHGRWFGPYLQPIPDLEDSLFPRKPQSHSVAPQLQQHTELSQRASHHHQSYHHDRSRDLPPISVASQATASRNPYSPVDHGTWERGPVWNTASSSSQRTHTNISSPNTMATDFRDDAVRQHAVSIDQAHELLDYFFSELNPPLALLDPSLHTVEYCRQQCPILFSTILSVASRFFMPQVHRQCHRIAKAVLNLAAAEEICTIDHIQALILVITWKDPQDKTILRKAVRAIGYAYELGLHAAFEAHQSSDTTKSHGASSDGNRAKSDSYGQRYKRRLDRDRQRTWIVLCLIHVLVRKDDRYTKPRARIIPLVDYPDPYIWLQQGGDVLLSIDSRLAWSLDMSIMTLEHEPLLDMIGRNQDASSFGGFFDRYRGRLDMLRKRYFDVRDGVYYSRFAMDKSSAVELSYIDAHRDFLICQSTWHWAAQVATQRRRTLSKLDQHDSSRSAFWFSQCVDGALRCLRLFVHDLCKQGHVRVGHDYLVITASEIAKWFYLYKDYIDAATLITAVDYLRATSRECSQPQRLASGEVVDTEREAPGYLVRFISAILEAGLNQSYDQAKVRLEASTDRFGAKAYHWGDAGGRGRALSNSAAEEKKGGRRESEGTRRPWATGHLSYQGSAQERDSAGERTGANTSSGNSPAYRDVVSAAARYAQTPSLSRGRSELGIGRLTTGALPSAMTSYERGGGSTDKLQTSPPTMFNTQATSMAAAGTSINSSSAIAAHPAYLASPSASGLTSALPSGLGGVQGAGGWSTGGNVAASWGSGGMLSAGGGVGGVGGTDLTASMGVQSTNKTGAAAGEAGLNVLPIAAEIGKNSIEGVAAYMNSRDLNYWQDILGFDLATPAI